MMRQIWYILLFLILATQTLGIAWRLQAGISVQEELEEAASSERRDDSE